MLKMNFMNSVKDNYNNHQEALYAEKTESSNISVISREFFNNSAFLN